MANAELAEIFLWITGSAYAVVHSGDAVLSSAMFQRRDLVYLGNLIYLSDTYCASAKVIGYVTLPRADQSADKVCRSVQHGSQCISVQQELQARWKLSEWPGICTLSSGLHAAQLP